ncbi:MAG TPA: nucleoside-triphosphatase, partial [Methylomirabilota bacterium]
MILRTLPLLSQPAAGFYTEEVRDAKAGGPGPRVGKYAVDLGSFEDIGVRALEAGLREPHHLLVLDELGK